VTRVWKRLAKISRTIIFNGIHRSILLKLAGETQSSGHESNRLQPEEAEVINSDELLRAEWSTVNDGIQTIYKILGPPPLKTLSGGLK
jgi:hypothetical protein